MPLISFITPVYNEKNYINKLLKNIEKNVNRNFEWIFVDDESTDNSYEIIQVLSKKFENIKLFKTRKKGKLNALNLAFEMSSGKYIKLVGGDDDIDFSILDYVKKFEYEKNFAFIHNAKIVDHKNNLIANFHPPYAVFTNEYDKYLENNISIASWCWTFTRDVAKKIFPMKNLHYEDLIISYVIKKYAKIDYVNKSFYYYKQNQKQTFGGIFSASKKIQKFRAHRTLMSLSNISKLDIFSFYEKKLIKKSKLYHFAIYKDFSFLKIIKSKVTNYRKLKLIINKYLYFFYKYILIIKFLVDKYILLKKFSENSFIKKNLNQEIELNEGYNSKKIIFVKSKVRYPTNDGYLRQYYGLINNLSNPKDMHFFFKTEELNINKFLDNYKNLKNVKIIDKYEFNFPFLIVKFFFDSLLHRLKIKKNNFIEELINHSKEKTTILFSDIVFYPLIFFIPQIRNIAIISITDFQTLRLLKLLFTSPGILKKMYYFTGSIHCLIVEFLLTKIAKKIHVYSPNEKDLLEKYFFAKNILSINNFHFNMFKLSNIEKNKEISDKKKIFINGNLNLPEIYRGVEKLINDKNFKKFDQVEFYVNGTIESKIKRNLMKKIKYINFNSSWMDPDKYLEYLNSFDLIFLPDIIEFGSSNRVLDSISSNTLVTGYAPAFAGINVKNFKEVIFIENSRDLFKAILMCEKNKSEIINCASEYMSININNEKTLKYWKQNLDT